ncbi:MAG: class I SAM-dependent methyltransferase [Oscillatoriales cyanobacterium C42_A2020_001]|nr:class I SAM-dependent methyltransferase [Leptolyngbyaceae cyanobacterium C42_A2020_001]
MSFQRMLIVLAAGIGSLGLGLIGYSQIREASTQVEQPTVTSQAVPSIQETQPGDTTQSPSRSPDVPYVPTPQAVVDEMLRLAKVTQSDRLYDLGSGDGRIVITAAKQYGISGVGVDIDPTRVKEATENAKQAGVSDRVEFRQQDLFQTDFKDATVVTLYLLPQINLRLRPKLLSELKPGTRIVSHAFDMGNWKPEKVVQVNGRTIYLWTVPEKTPANLR